MKTNEDREREFRKDFKALLEKHGAEFDLEIGGHPECRVASATITMYSKYDENDEITHDFCEFDL